MNVAEGYACLMGRFALPLFHTQSFDRGRTYGKKHGKPSVASVAGMTGGSRYALTGTHPEAVVKAHRHMVSLLNRELHGNNWKRKGIVGVQSILGVERHKSGDPHSHAVMGHPDIDLGAPEFSALRRTLRETCNHEWGISDLQVAKSAAHCNAYVSKYIVKEGEIVLSANLAALATGQLSIIRAIASTPRTETQAGTLAPA